MHGLLCTIALLLPPQGGAEPEWIWAGEQSAEHEVCYFRREFDLEQPVVSARLVASCDNHFVAWINGERVANGDNWERPVARDVEVAFERGRNVLAIKGWNDGGAAGLIARLDLKLASGAVVRVATDATWRVAGEQQAGWRDRALDASGWRTAYSFGRSSAHRGPWNDVLAPRQATPAESLVAAPGFAVELLRSAQLGEGSWVCLTFDDRGRLIVSPQNGGLLRMTLPDGDGGDTRVEALDAPVGSAQGLLFTRGSLFVNVNARPEDNGGLWRLRDTDGDDRFDEVERLSSWGPGGEHGPHAVVEGPEGKLWVVNGNMTSRPDVAPSSPHAHYAEDLLLPRATDPRGHAVSVRAPGSVVLRYDPDAGDGGWELWASGMRNAYDLAFDPDGELFSFDSDMEWDIGLPWYRPTRIVHVVSGGEYGWRTGSGKWPTWYPDSLPAVVDVGVSSPTGLAFGTASHFPEPYRSALFVGDWAYGRILAVHLEPDGASYRGSFEEFVKGLPLNVTDFQFGPDGAMYFVTGGRGTQSGLYRVRAMHPVLAASPRAPATNPDRELRRQLEAWHQVRSIDAVAAAWPHLDHRDRFIRYAARIAIEHQDPAWWRDRALGESRADAALEALLALARVGDATDQQALLDRLGELGPDGLGEDRLSRWLRVHDVCLVRMGRPGPGELAALRARLEPLFPAPSYRLDRDLCRLLVYLESPVAVVRSMQLLRKSRSEGEQIRYAFDLRSCSVGWTPELREEYFAWLGRARELEGGPSFPGYIEKIREDALASMEPGERAAWEARSQPNERADEPREVAAPVLRNWQLADLSGDLDGVGHGRSFASGEASFQGLCATCHRFGSKGGSIGPDLTGAARRFSRLELLESILQPSKVISDQYQAMVVTKKNGELVVGRIVEDDDAKIVLLLGIYGDDRAEVRKQDIKSLDASPVSLMPPGLLNALRREQILDLLAYLEAAGDPNQPAFKD